MRKDILENKDKILKWIEKKESKAFICKELKCKPITLNSYLVKMNIDYKGNKGSKGKSSTLKKKAKIFLIYGSLIHSSKLRKKLIEENIKNDKCEKCNIVDWNGEKITMELHHINGDRFDNRLFNLKILCPNCHSQTLNYSGKKNIKKTKKIKNCKCGIKINKKSNLCISCSNKEKNYNLRKVKNRPSHEQLLKDIKELNYTNTGKKYGVSDNTIRKWIKKYAQVMKMVDM